MKAKYIDNACVHNTVTKCYFLTQVQGSNSTQQWHIVTTHISGHACFWWYEVYSYLATCLTAVSLDSSKQNLVFLFYSKLYIKKLYKQH